MAFWFWGGTGFASRGTGIGRLGLRVDNINLSRKKLEARYKGEKLNFTPIIEVKSKFKMQLSQIPLMEIEKCQCPWHFSLFEYFWQWGVFIIANSYISIKP